MYSTVSFALALCDTSVFQNPSSSSRAVPSPLGPSSLAAAGAVEVERAVVAEMRHAGWWLVAGGVLYMGSYGLVFGIPGRIGICGFALVTLGAILASGGLSGHDIGGASARRGSDPFPASESAEQVELPLVPGKEEDVLPDVAASCSSSSFSSSCCCCWWNVWLLRGYFTIIYFYAGVAKLETDWMDGWTIREVLRLWTGNIFVLENEAAA